MPSLKIQCRRYKAVGLLLLMGMVSILGSAMPAGAEPLHAEIYPQLGHTGGVLSAVVSPDARMVLTGGNDSTARFRSVWRDSPHNFICNRRIPIFGWRFA